jgi:subtilisin family serine protease
MQQDARRQPKRKLAVGALFLLAATLAVGLGLAGRASAIDLTEQLKKAAKDAAGKKSTPAKGTPVPKALPLAKGAVLPSGVVRPNNPALPNSAGLPKGVALPKGPTPPNNAALPKGPTLPNSAALPKGPTLPNNTALPKGPTLPNNAGLPKGPTLPNNAALPKGATLPNNAALPKGATLPNNAALPKGATLPNNAALPKGATLPNNAALPKGVALPKGAALPLPKGGALPNNAALPKGVALPKGAALPLPKGAALPNSAALPKAIRPNFNPATTPPAIMNRPAAAVLTNPRRDFLRMPAPDYRRVFIEHRTSIMLAHSRLPFRPLPGQSGFTGVPVVGETRFVTNEMVFRVGPNTSQQQIDAIANRLGLTAVATESVGVAGGTLIHFRVAGTRPVADVVRDLEAENVGVASPNYVYRTLQDESLAARTASGSADQYVVNKLRLGEVHRVATGSDVLVAVIDSKIDSAHPDLAGAIVEHYDAVGRKEQPHSHGTGMAGAIAARKALMGVAPAAKILAIHAFSTESRESPQATTRHILAGLDYAIKKGARVINMSFAGPYDPMLQLAMKNARDKGVVLIAAAGNAGPKSPPLYPAADPNVIAVTATDQDDKLFAQANQGPYVAVAAPGVDILEPAPNGTYQVTTGTSVAAAHVSGVVALLLERNPALDPATVHEILTLSAKNPESTTGRDDKLGWGVIDPSQALLDLDAKIAIEQDSPSANPAAPKPAAPPSSSVPVATRSAPTPAAAKQPAGPKPAAAQPTPVSVR